jgi:caffeoyl-CoA O-methyltransferase
MLYMLVKISNAKRILEIGTLGGYSTIWLAKGLDRQGQILSLEISPALTKFATENLKKEGLETLVSFEIGHALESLNELEKEGRYFDFIFIDADKVNYVNYLKKALKITRSGALIVADNVLWHNRIFNEQDQDASTNAIREFNKYIAEHSNLESILLPMGDGLAVSRVK